MRKISYRTPDLSGVQTWVQNQDNASKLPQPNPTRPDYADGQPQRDRVLPLPSGHPEGRDEKRVGPPVYNSPSDSMDNSSSNSIPRKPYAQTPKGKPLNESPRTKGIPGDQYGQPYIDGGTMLNQRRTMTANLLKLYHVKKAVVDQYLLNSFGIRDAYDINFKPKLRSQRQHKTRGLDKIQQKNYYRRNKNKIKRQNRQYARQHKVELKRYRENYNKNPEKFQRLRPKNASGTNMTSLTILQSLLSGLRSAQFAHLTSHWQVNGQSYYGDHLLMMRLYESVTDEIDTLAEKMVAQYGVDAVSPMPQLTMMSTHLNSLIQKEKSPLHRALLVEESLQGLFKWAYENLKKQNSMSLGMDDFIMATANSHEGNLYLLRQRFR